MNTFFPHIYRILKKMRKKFPEQLGIFFLKNMCFLDISRLSKLCGTQLLSATRPSKLIKGCQGHPPLCLSPGTAQRQWNPEVKLLNAQHLIQLTFVDSRGWHKVQKAVEAWKQKWFAYYDICIMTLFTHYGTYFWLELAYAFHTMKTYTNHMRQPACFSLTFDLQLLSEL
jgi:hypothetical protein